MNRELPPCLVRCLVSTSLAECPVVHRQVTFSDISSQSKNDYRNAHFAFFPLTIRASFLPGLLLGGRCEEFWELSKGLVTLNGSLGFRGQPGLLNSLGSTRCHDVKLFLCDGPWPIPYWSKCTLIPRIRVSLADEGPDPSPVIRGAYPRCCNLGQG